MDKFDTTFEAWMEKNVLEETNPRRRELLEKGLGYGTVEFLRKIWYPMVGNFDHLYPEWEIRDFNNRYRYLDLAYMPVGVKGCIEIQGYGPHARDLNVSRFKDLCWRHSLLALEGWTILPIAYLTIKEEPKQCQQLILAFVGKFLVTETPTKLTWLEAEVVRYTRRSLLPVSPQELTDHLRISDRHLRRILHNLVDLQILTIASGNLRARTYKLKL